jgi:hypothetical protein
LPNKRTLYLLFTKLLLQGTAVVAAVVVMVVVASYLGMPMVPRPAAEDYYAQPWEELWNTSCRTVDVEAVVVLVVVNI